MLHLKSLLIPLVISLLIGWQQTLPLILLLDHVTDSCAYLRANWTTDTMDLVTWWVKTELCDVVYYSLATIIMMFGIFFINSRSLFMISSNNMYTFHKPYVAFYLWFSDFLIGDYCWIRSQNCIAIMNLNILKWFPCCKYQDNMNISMIH